MLIEPIAEPDSILLGVTLDPAISLVNINGRAHTHNSNIIYLFNSSIKHLIIQSFKKQKEKSLNVRDTKKNGNDLIHIESKHKSEIRM